MCKCVYAYGRWGVGTLCPPVDAVLEVPWRPLIAAWRGSICLDVVVAASDVFDFLKFSHCVINYKKVSYCKKKSANG